MSTSNVLSVSPASTPPPERLRASSFARAPVSPVRRIRASQPLLSAGFSGLTILTVAILHGPASFAAPPPARADYADQCAEQMGVIPPFNCLDGDLLEITVNGVSQTKPVADGKCDNPVQLGMSGNQCVPFSRLHNLNTGKPSVTTLAICRKYIASNGPRDPFFDDIAVIQHDRTTGRTCFFQSPLRKKLDGQTVPSPSERSVAASTYWMENENRGPGGIACTGCHSADPFIWSPYVAQKANLPTWNPLGEFDSNFANLFGAPATLIQPEKNACVSCHRFGVSSESGWGCGPLTSRYIGSTPHVMTTPSILMPPGYAGNSAGFEMLFGPSARQIQLCCSNPTLPECKSRPANGSTAPPAWIVPLLTHLL